MVARNHARAARGNGPVVLWLRRTTTHAVSTEQDLAGRLRPSEPTSLALLKWPPASVREGDTAQGGSGLCGGHHAGGRWGQLTPCLSLPTATSRSNFSLVPPASRLGFSLVQCPAPQHPSRPRSVRPSSPARSPCALVLSLALSHSHRADVAETSRVALSSSR